MGGRGSGKTTVLRCLSYEGQEALNYFESASPDFVGVYYKINTNVVTAFDGQDLNITNWRRLFGHFLNLTICGELAKYLSWYQKNFYNSNIENLSFSQVCNSLGFQDDTDLNRLIEKISEASTLLELYINNIGGSPPRISQLQSPVDKFLKLLKEVPGHEETVFHIILDEYENLLDYQQKIVNTLIKHSGDNCYFKIGVRELGWRVRITLNDNETLISPADYELIRIEEKLKENFESFAQTVCESRLQSKQGLINQCLGLDKLLPSISTHDEAKILGVNKRVATLREDLKRHYPNFTIPDSLHDFELFVFYLLNQKDLKKTLSDINAYTKRQQKAVDKYRNHSHALLYAVADKGTSISKHYCGHKIFARIANRNIRFYMQLVHESIVQHTSERKSLNEPIGYKDQTVAARRVGLNYIRELEGVTARGSYLSKLILGFGRYFQILAANPIGVSPECNQFHLKITESIPKEEKEKSQELLIDAVMHLALVRSPGTKLATDSDTHSWDYSPHPIFSPYFNYSTRRKRKIQISDSDLISMSKFPQLTIRRLLGKNRQHLADEDLPEQLNIFDELFNSDLTLPSSS